VAEDRVHLESTDFMEKLLVIAPKNTYKSVFRSKVDGFVKLTNL